MTYRAVVFDLDGVLWDGEPIYHEAFNIVLEPMGHVVTPEEYEQIIGNSVEAAWAWVLDHFRIEEPADHFYPLYDDAVMKLLASGAVEPLPGARETIERLRGIPVPVGLASASLVVGAAAPVTSGVLAVSAVLVMITTRRSGSPRD